MIGDTLKGKVEEIQTERNAKGRYSVSMRITTKKGLSYERSEALVTDFKEKYLGKLVEIAELNTLIGPSPETPVLSP